MNFFIDNFLGLSSYFNGSDDERIAHNALRAASLFDFGGDQFGRVDGALFAADLFDLRAYKRLLDGYLSFRVISASSHVDVFQQNGRLITQKRKIRNPTNRCQFL